MNGICPAGYTLQTTVSSQSYVPSTLYPVPTAGDGCIPQVYYYPVVGATGQTGQVANINIDGTGATEGCILRYNSDGKWVVDGKQSVQVGQFSYSAGQGVALGINAKTGMYGTSVGNAAGSSIYNYNMVLNGTGLPLVPTSNNSCWIKPIRGESVPAVVATLKTLMYNEVSGEVVYDAT
jgi:hypothetical protein